MTAGSFVRGWRRAARGQSGASLLELTIALMLIGLSLVSLVGLVYANLAAAAAHEAVVRAGNRASEVAESIDGLTYVGCPSAAAPNPVYQSVLDTSAAGTFTEQIVSVEFLADRTTSTPAWQPSCPGVDQGAQRVTIRVTTRTAPVVTSDVVLVKRDRTCPSGLTQGVC